MTSGPSPSSDEPPDGAPPAVPPSGTPGAGTSGADESGGAARRKPFLLRLPPQLMAELKGWSAQEMRSVNAHIEFLLREAVKKRKSRS
jgi:hypothetical protein